MIIRAVHIEHWSCISKLGLENLGAGIVVFRGPNGTGKSSLVRAIRCCLLDFDHDTTGGKLKKNIPWNGQGPPRVAVQFQTGGAEYRITKVFSKKSDGLALLEKKVGAQWQVEEDSPKEASRKTRELLEADKSTEGSNQLLWLDQGEIGLPKSDSLDASLERALVSVLGVLVTGSDLAFKEELDKRYARWFREGGKYRQNSPVTLLEHQKQEFSRTRDQERQKWTELEKAFQTMEVCLDELAPLRSLVQEAHEEAQRLEEEQKRSLERRTRYAEAEKALERARQDLDHAEQALNNLRQAQERARQSAQEVERLRNMAEGAKITADELVRQHTSKQQALVRARNVEDAHQQLGADIEDRRKLVASSQKLLQLQKSLSAIKTLEQRIQELENKIKTTLVPDETGLEELRKNRRKAQQLRANLTAEALMMNVSIDKPTCMFLSLDNNKDKEPVELSAGEKKSWSVQQRAKIEICDWGTIELGRSHENLDFERSARQLTNLDRDFNDAIHTYEEDPLDQRSLDRLSERRILRDSWQIELSKLRNELATKAPKGRGILESECAELETLRQAIVQRRPELSQWLPNESEVDVLQVTHGQQAKAFREARLQLEAEEKQAQRNLEEAQSKLQAHEKALTGACATAQANHEELLRMGDEALLLVAVENAKTNKTEAEKNLADSLLTDEEKTVDERCQLARTALHQRQDRLRQMEQQLTDLSIILKGNEALHANLANAEAAVQQADSALDREKLEAQAHRRLSDLFESCRESRVQRVIGPVAGRVLEWAKRIGLNDYHEVRFGDKFLPEGIVRQSTSLVSAVAIEDEGYGTSEQLSLLVRLALGGILAKNEPALAILDDPLAHTDPAKHRKILDILRIAAEGNKTWNPPAGPLQIIILTCHPDRFDYLPGARHYDLARLICR